MESKSSFGEIDEKTIQKWEAFIAKLDLQMALKEAFTPDDFPKIIIPDRRIDPDKQIVKYKDETNAG